MWRLAVLALGLWVGAMGAVVHRQVWLVGPWQVPWGLLVVLVTTGVLAHAAGRWRRLGAAWFALGWSLLLTAQPLLPNGGYLVATDWLGWAHTLLTAGVIVAVVVRAPRLDP